jgi:hypothetical protein
MLLLLPRVLEEGDAPSVAIIRDTKANVKATVALAVNITIVELRMLR